MVLIKFCGTPQNLNLKVEERNVCVCGGEERAFVREDCLVVPAAQTRNNTETVLINQYLAH